MTNILVTSKIDTYGLCNILYQILTKHTPYKWLEPNGRPSLQEVISMKLNGTRPYFSREFTSERSQYQHPPRHALYLAASECYQLDPHQRLSARHIYEYLEQSLRMIEGSKHHKKKEVNLKLASLKKIFMDINETIKV